MVRPGRVLRHATARLCAGDVPWRFVLLRRHLPLVETSLSEFGFFCSSHLAANPKTVRC